MSDRARSRVFETDAVTSERMSRVRQRGTSPELAVQRALRSLGVSFSKSNRRLPGSPDLSNSRQQWAIFVHGCYWHRHPGCNRTTTPRRNRELWEEKFAANVARDRANQRALRNRGYSVAVIWECDTHEAYALARRVARILRRATRRREERRSNVLSRSRPRNSIGSTARDLKNRKRRAP